MDPATTVTIPLAPTVFWPLAFLVSFAVASLAVYAFLPDDRRPAPITGWLRKTGIPLWLAAFVGIVFAILFVIALWASLVALWSQIATPARPGEGASGLGTSALIAALLGAPLILWRTMVAQRTVNIAQETHVTDLLAKAVEQLGAEKTVKRPSTPYAEGMTAEARSAEETVPNLEVRIGAILALERLARQNLDVHVQIMEILTAYIRTNAPAESSPKLPEPPEDYTPDDHEGWSESLHTWSAAHRNALANFRPREDIQLALTVLGRRSAEQRGAEARWRNSDPVARFVYDDPSPQVAAPQSNRGPAQESASSHPDSDLQKKFESYAGYRLDLRRTNLRTANLRNCNLGGAILDRSELQGANLFNAQLNGASFRSANLQHARLDSASLQCAALNGAKFQCVRFGMARLQGAVFGQVNQILAGPPAANLQGANLATCHIEGANLNKVKLHGADIDISQMPDLKGALFDVWQQEREPQDVDPIDLNPVTT